MTLIAVTRPVSASLAACELTHLDRVPIDVTRAAAQHAAYESLLQALGATIVRVPAAPSFPDAVFIEDTALVLDEIAIMTRPGAETRRGELADVVPIVVTDMRINARPPVTVAERARRASHANGARRQPASP